MGTAYSQESFFKRITGRQAQYIQRRSLYDAQRDVIVELTRPDLVAGQTGEKAEGAFEGSKIIEGSAPHALRIWSRGFRSNLLSRREPWFRERAKEPDRNTGVTFDGNDEVNQYQQDLADHLRAVYRRSNYYDKIGGFILDGGSIGSPVMLYQKDLAQDRMICRNPDYASVWLDKDIFGLDNALHVRHMWTALEAEQMFGKDQLTPPVQRQLENGEHYTKTPYLQVIYSAGDEIYKNLPDNEDVPQTHPWLEHYICESASGPPEEKLLKPKNFGPGYFTRPWSSWHTDRLDHESYSRTMAWWAIYDVRGSNGMWEALFGEAELSLKPPIWALGSYRGQLDLSPAGDNWAQNAQEYATPPMFLDRKTSYSTGMDFADRLQASVRRHFHYDFFMAVNQIIMSKNQPETAFGLRRAQAENGVQLVDEIESAEQQVLGHGHDVMLASEIMAEPAYPWGRLPEPPPIMQEFSDGNVDVEFIGRLSMLEVNNRRVQRFFSGVEMALAVQPLDETAAQLKVRWPDELERVLEAENFEQAGIRSQEEYDELVETLTQRATRQELAENAPKMAKAAKDLQKQTEEGSPLAALTGGGV